MIPDSKPLDKKSGSSADFEKSCSQGTAHVASGVSNMAPVVSVGTGAVEMQAANADDIILAAQGHKAAMPRLFSAMSSLGFMFWYVFRPMAPLSTNS